MPENTVLGTRNLAVRLGLKGLSSVVWVIRGSFPDYPKAELGDLGFSGRQVVPTTFQPLQAQPVRRRITTVGNHFLSSALLMTDGWKDKGGGPAIRKLNFLIVACSPARWNGPSRVLESQRLHGNPRAQPVPHDFFEKLD